MLNAIENDLREHIDFSYVRKTHLNSVRYKDYYGVRMSVNREISHKYYQRIEDWDKDKYSMYAKNYVAIGNLLCKKDADGF